MMADSQRLSPTARPVLQPGPLIAALERHKVDWVLCGSQVLALHGAQIAPNDLDVVPDLTPENLKRVTACLDQLGAVKAYLDGWGGARGTYEACVKWRPNESSTAHLDWLFVTPFGMLDIVIELAEPFQIIMEDAARMQVGGHNVWVSHPRRVLRALESRSRTKDRERADIYRQMRRRFDLPDLPVRRD